jgi:predicted DCC family thiol-disulfide oxidoreductase YuxK
MRHQIILFDGVCNFCNWWVDFVIRKDINDSFRFAALQSETGRKYLERFGFNTTDFDTFILIKEDNYFTRSTAALKIVRELNSWLKIFYPMIFLPRLIRDFIYNLIARNRYKIFGKRDICRVPTDEEKKKFI